MNPQAGDDRMVMTVLEAHLVPEQAAALEQIYQAAGSQLPLQMVQTALVQSVNDPTLWRAISIWRSRAALDEYRRSVETPGGVRMFQAVGSAFRRRSGRSAKSRTTMSKSEAAASACAAPIESARERSFEVVPRSQTKFRNETPA